MVSAGRAVEVSRDFYRETMPTQPHAPASTTQDSWSRSSQEIGRSWWQVAAHGTEWLLLERFNTFGSFRAPEEVT